MNEFKAYLKCGRPINSKDKNPWKRQEANNIDGQAKDNQEKLIAPEEPSPKELLSPEENVVIPKET